MKKTILIILAVLPIVLLIIIAFAGRILSIYQYISVERVEFVDRIGTAYTDDIDFTVPQGGEKSTAIRIYPELATNKNVTYFSGDENICTVDANGVIRGVHYGHTTVSVKTDDGAKVAILNVLVTADVPYSVTISKSEHSMSIGESYAFSAEVDAPVSLDKRVTYSSSDPTIVSVDKLGKITAHAAGEVFITVTTVLGGITDTCKVTVIDSASAISFDFINAEGVEQTGVGYKVSTASLNILDYLVVGDGFDKSDVVIELDSDYATLENGVITHVRGISGLGTLTAYIGDKNSPDAIIEITFLFI